MSEEDKRPRIDYEGIYESGKLVGLKATIYFDPNPKPSASGKNTTLFTTHGLTPFNVGGADYKHNITITTKR
jgi:hypothetical protein